MADEHSRSLQIFDSLSLLLRHRISGVPESCSFFKLSCPFYKKFFTMRTFLLRRNFKKLMQQFQNDAFLSGKIRSLRTPKYHKVALTSCSPSPERAPGGSSTTWTRSSDKVDSSLTSGFPDFTPDEDVLDHIQLLSQRLRDYSQFQLKRRNPMDKILLFGKRVLKVSAKGVLEPKFAKKTRVRRDQFKHFADISVQLTALFDMQIGMLIMVLDLFLQMSQFLYKYLIEDCPRRNTKSPPTPEEHVFEDSPALTPSENLIRVLKTLAQLCYIVGSFNSFSKNIMRLVDESQFGTCVFIDKYNKFHVTLDASRRSPSSYLAQLGAEQQLLSEKVFAEVNARIVDMEGCLEAEIPQIRRSMTEFVDIFNSGLSNPQIKKLGKLCNKKSLFPKLSLYSKPETPDFVMKDINAMEYAAFSELILLRTTSNALLVFNLSHLACMYTLVDWPFSLSRVLIRRNLASYKAKLLSQKRFLGLHEFPERVSIDLGLQPKDAPQLEDSFLESDLEDIVYLAKTIGEYFRNMENQSWISPEFTAETFIIAVENADANEMLMFTMEFDQRPGQHPDRQSLKLSWSELRPDKLVSLGRLQQSQKKLTDLRHQNSMPEAMKPVLVKSERMIQSTVDLGEEGQAEENRKEALLVNLYKDLKWQLSLRQWKKLEMPKKGKMLFVGDSLDLIGLGKNVKEFGVMDFDGFCKEIGLDNNLEVWNFYDSNEQFFKTIDSFKVENESANLKKKKVT